MNQYISRRDVLRAGAATVGTGVAGGLAGCEQAEQFTGGEDDADAEPADETETESGTDSDTGGTVAQYWTWLPQPDAFDTGHYSFESIDYGVVRDHESEFNPEVYDSYADKALFSELELAFADLDHGIEIGPASETSPAIVTGSFSADDIADRLTELGYAEGPTVGEYSVYGGDAEIGVTDGTLVYAENAAADYVRTLIRTRNGELTRYTATSADMTSLVERFGSETFVYGSTNDAYTEAEHDPEGGQFAGQVGIGWGDTVRGETTSVEIAILFETVADVDMDAISQYTDSDLFAAYDSVSSAQDGRTAVVSGIVPTDELYS
ncbi:twin-arginine translocation signal domain-containing protein [Haloarcula laminariae]|uniref:twin-arginine translocation signal domain-containing protein n=1 Tax=Haloarcula laminariae TaxID=2961577 RepID=UPI0021C8CA25|nr:twin-arginine translocation signal domain-containing protein [Halomicroarcula laminariae]